MCQKKLSFLTKNVVNIQREIKETEDFRTFPQLPW